MKKVKISAVSYLNTKPFLYGLEHNNVANQIDLQLDIPSECARKLIAGEVELGLVPVAVIPKVKNAQVISDYCIGAIGEVKTVCVYSDCPMSEIETLYLDYQSRTSVALTKYLIQNYWKVTPKMVAAQAGYESKIAGKTAALIIGDRTIGLDTAYPYIYDLGTAWQDHTGLPFVFAAWVSNTELSDDFVTEFNAALQVGIAERAAVAATFQQGVSNFSVYDYYYKYINYELDTQKKIALERFLGAISPQTELVLR